MKTKEKRIYELRHAYPMLSLGQVYCFYWHEQAGTLPEEDIRQAVMGEAWIPLAEHAKKWGYSPVEADVVEGS